MKMINLVALIKPPQKLAYHKSLYGRGIPGN